MSLRQNLAWKPRWRTWFSYQSECHCAKTNNGADSYDRLFSYQSECHCAKTVTVTFDSLNGFSYQSECHCAKTGPKPVSAGPRFSYQSECHCAKTVNHSIRCFLRLVTSQNVTAPKQYL